MNKWALGFNNTKLFDVTSKMGRWTNDTFVCLQGCKTCNEVTKLNDWCKDRQLLGNVYQSLCTCSKCGNYVICDEHNYDMLEFYLTQ